VPANLSGLAEDEPVPHCLRLSGDALPWSILSARQDDLGLDTTRAVLTGFHTTWHWRP